MAFFTLPAEPLLKVYSFTAELDGAVFELTFRFSVRDDAYYFSIADSAGNPILDGRKVVTNTEMLAGIPGGVRPLGELYILDNAELNRPPRFPELGDLYELVYIDGAELGRV